MFPSPPDKDAMPMTKVEAIRKAVTLKVANQIFGIILHSYVA
jgi:hypothetical protein